MVKETVSPFLNILWNTFQYYKQLNNPGKGKQEIEDKWILSRLNSLDKETTENLEKFYIEKGLKPIMDFVSNDFSRKYIKIVRDREDKNVKMVIGEILDKISRLLAPYAPNIAEVLHNEFEKCSVHLSDWPKTNEKAIDKKLEENFEIVFEIIEKGLAARDKEKIGLRWPLQQAMVLCKNGREIEKFSEIIARQLNVKEVEFREDKEISVKLDTKMTPELEAEGFAREISRAVQAERKKKGLVKDDKIKLSVAGSKGLIKKLEKVSEIIKERTNSKSVSFTTEKLNGTRFKVKDEDVAIVFERI
jgi:isoleucyl-tRNA synthetase